MSGTDWGEALYKPPEPSEVFATCPAKVGKECQLCLSVVSDQILSRGSMTCIAMSLCAVASMIRVFGSERVECVACALCCALLCSR